MSWHTTTVYYLIAVVMFLTGGALLVQLITKVKNPLWQMFLGVISLGLIACAVAVFIGVSS
jgi:hypothetical protein